MVTIRVHISKRMELEDFCRLTMEIKVNVQYLSYNIDKIW